MIGLIVIILLLGLLIFHLTHGLASQNSPKSNSTKKEASSKKEKTSSETQTALKIKTSPEEKSASTNDSSDDDSSSDDSSNTDNTSKEPDVTSDNPEVQLLARLVNAEAGGASKQTQIAVASVVLNRVNSDKYPDTISEVIYQSGQYTPAHNGAIDRTPTEESVESALYVYKNGSQIPSNVLYQSKFIQGSGIWAQLDGDYFCYE